MYHSRLHATNGMTSLALDAVSGGWLELVCEGTQDNYIKNHLAAEESPFRLILHTEQGLLEARPASSREIDLNPALKPTLCIQQQPQHAAVTAQYPAVMINGEPLPVTVRWEAQLLPNDPRIHLSLSVENHSTLEIEQALFPCVNGLWLGDTWQDDVLYMPKHAGQRVVNPVECLAAPASRIHWKWQEYDYNMALNGPNGVLDSRGAYVWELNYSGECSMLWLDLFDDAEGDGLYLTCRNSSGRMKKLRAESFGPQDPGLNVAVAHYLFLGEGQNWHSEECIVAPHQGSWHWAADEYRTWREATPIVEPDGTRWVVPVDAQGNGPLHPSWIDHSPGLMAHYDFQYQTGGVVHTYKDIPRLYEEAKSFGLNHILLSGWNESGFDYGFPQYRPNPLLGTEQELRDGVRAVIAAGGHVAFYVNARLCNTVFPDRESLWKNGGIQNRDGSPFLEQYGSHNQYFASMCSQAELWQSELLSAFHWLMHDIGADSLYLDQLAMATSCLCFSHAHEDHLDVKDGWNTGVRRLLARIAQDAPASGVALLMEGANDTYCTGASGGLISTMFYEMAGAFPELYRYTFPNHPLVDMMNPRRHSGMRAEHLARRACKLLFRAFVDGMYLWNYDLFEDNCYQPDDPQAVRVKQVHALRRTWLDHYGRGRFADVLGLLPSCASVMARRYELADGRVLIACAREGGLTGTLQIRLPIDIWKATLATIDGETPLAFDRSIEGTVSFALPQTELALIVLEG